MHVDSQIGRTMVATFRQRREGRPWLQLLNAVLALAGPSAELVRHAERPWASATFSGSRHTVVLQFGGAAGVLAAEDFVEALPDHEFALTARLVADASVTALEQVAGRDPRVTIEASFLLLDDL